MEAAGRRYIVHPSRSDWIRIWNLSDLHYLAKGCAVGDIKRDIKEIADDTHSFWLGGGDMVDFIGYRDKRFDPDSVADWVPISALGDLGRYGCEKIRDLLLPIKHKCLGMLIGNHEKQYELHTEQESLHHWLCEELGVMSLEYCAFFDIAFHRTKCKQPKLVLSPPPSDKSTSSVFRFFVHHGAGYANTPGGKLNRLIQFMQSFDADCYMVGHVHDHVARKEPAISANADCLRLTERQRLGVVAGSYLKTYTQGNIGYGEMRGYRPTALGAAIVRIKPATREMEAAV